jgi:protein CpxP
LSIFKKRKAMKKIWAITLCLSLFISKGIAQIQREANPSQSTATNSDKKSEKLEMIKSLNLSKEQMGQLKEFRRSVKQMKEDINNDPHLNEEQKQTKLKELHKGQKQKLDAILTPEQREQLKRERKNATMQKEKMNYSDSTREIAN